MHTYQAEGVTIELTREMNYQLIVQALANALKLYDPTCIRLTQHNSFSQQPQRTPVKFNGIDRLDSLLHHGNTVTNILYYEVLDQPLPEVERLKVLKVG